MAKISNVEAVLQESEFPKILVPTKLRQGYYENKEGNKALWVHLDCVDEVVYSNASTLGIDPEDLPTITVKVKNPDARNWVALVGESITTTSAVVVPIISNNQLKALALSIDATNI